MNGARLIPRRLGHERCWIEWRSECGCCALFLRRPANNHDVWRRVCFPLTRPLATARRRLRPISVSGSERIGWRQAAAESERSFPLSVHRVRRRRAVRLARRSVQQAQTAAPPASPSCRRCAQPHGITSRQRLRCAEPKSTPLYVVVGMAKVAAAESERLIPPRGPCATSDGVRLSVQTLAIGLDTPSALAATSGARIFIAQGSGDVYVSEGQPDSPDPCISLPDVSESGRGLVGD